MVFMTSMRAIADTTPTRSELRLVVLAQWIAAGLALIRGATTTGRGLVGGAVALWRLAQAVRLAILLARRLKQAQDAAGAGASAPASTPISAWPHEAAPLSDDALRRAMAELEAAMAGALAATPQGRASVWDRAWDRVWDRELPARIFPRASQEAPGPSPRSLGRRTPPQGRRPLRPPGPERPCRRRWRTPGALIPAPTPIAALATGRDPLAPRPPVREAWRLWIQAACRTCTARSATRSRTRSPKARIWGATAWA